MIYAACFNYIPVTFSWTGAARTQPGPGSPGSALLLPAGPGTVPGRAATPTPRNMLWRRHPKMLLVAREIFSVYPHSRVVLDSAAVFSSVRRKRRSFTRFSSTVEGRDPGRHFPKGCGGRPHPSPGTSKGRRSPQPRFPPPLGLGPDSNFCLHQEQGSSRSHSEGLQQAEAGGCWSALDEGALPQTTSKLGHTTSSCLPAGRAKEPGGMRSSVAVTGAGPRLSPGLPGSPGPSEDSEMQWDTPGGTGGP